MELDLQAEILREHSEAISKEIESSLMNYLMMKYWEEQGWIPVKLSRFQDNRHAVDITYWLDEQGFKEKDDYYRDGREFLFRESKHATLFIMRWA